ncbi:MAG: hypothetical protein J6Y37_11570 [Paludibacteraceae bacterium]|nr:hypothetical protein [Paludibacteraceae bacterium]
MVGYSNAILSALESMGHRVIRLNAGEYSVYDGVDYMFTVSCGRSRKKSVFFNGLRYSSVDALLSAFREFEALLPFPASTYNPCISDNFREEMRIRWYLSSVLGMEACRVNVWGIDFSYCLKDVCGRKLVEVSFNQDDCGSGRFWIPLGDGSVVTEEYADASDAVGKLNTLLTSCVAMSYDACGGFIGKVAGRFGDVDGSRLLSPTLQDALSGGRDYKAVLIETLEGMLSVLKGGVCGK